MHHSRWGYQRIFLLVSVCLSVHFVKGVYGATQILLSVARYTSHDGDKKKKDSNTGYVILCLSFRNVKWTWKRFCPCFFSCYQFYGVTRSLTSEFTCSESIFFTVQKIEYSWQHATWYVQNILSYFAGYIGLWSHKKTNKQTNKQNKIKNKKTVTQKTVKFLFREVILQSLLSVTSVKANEYYSNIKACFTLKRRIPKIDCGWSHSLRAVSIY